METTHISGDVNGSAIGNYNTINNHFGIYTFETLFGGLKHDTEETLKRYQEYRELEELNQVDFKNKDICTIYGLPKVGKTIFAKLWAYNNRDEYNIGYFSCRKNNQNDFFLQYTRTFFEKIKENESQKYLLIIDDIEQIKENLILKDNINRFIENFDPSGYPNLKLFILGWENINDYIGITFEGKKIQKLPLSSYNINDIKDKFIEKGYSLEEFEKIKKHYGRHSFILERILKQEIPIIGKALRSKKLLEILGEGYASLFKEITEDYDLRVFFEVIIFQHIQNVNGLNVDVFLKFKKLGLIEQENENDYLVHHYIVSLFYEYLKKNKKLLKQFTNFILDKIKGNIQEREISYLFFAFYNILDDIEDNQQEGITEIFKKYYEQDDYFINIIFSGDINAKLSRLEKIKNIIGVDYYLRKSILLKSAEDYQNALEELENYYNEKKDSQGEFHYNYEKGNIILKQFQSREINSTNIEDIIEYFKKSIKYRNEFLDINSIVNIDDEYKQKEKLKTYLFPVIDLANLYINQKDIESAYDLLEGEYIKLENNKLKNNTFFNLLGDFYQEIRYNDRAILCYKKALEIKPNHYKALFNLGKLYVIKGKYDKALEIFKKGIDDNIFHKKNYIVYRYYATCIREYQKDYNKSIEIINKGLFKFISKNNLEQRKESINQLFITYIKKGNFSALYNNEYYNEHQDIFKSVIGKSNMLLNNIQNVHKEKIIDGLLEAYYQYEGGYIFENQINFVFTKKIKYLIKISKSINDCLLYVKSLGKYLYNNEYQKPKYKPKIIFTKFSSKEKEIIADNIKNILEQGETFEFHIYKYYLLQFVIFSTDNQYKYNVLNGFFNIFGYDKKSFQLFKHFKEICLSSDRLDFLKYIPKEESLLKDLLHSFRFYLPKIAHILEKQNKLKEAGEYYKYAIDYDSTFQNYLNYTIFSLKILQLSDFKDNYYNCIKTYKGKVKKGVKRVFMGVLNSYDFKIQPFLNETYEDIIKKYETEIKDINQKFDIDFELKILEAYTKSIKDISLNELLAKKYYDNEKYFLALQEFKKLPNKKDYNTEIEACKTHTKIIKYSNKSFRKKIAIADKLYEIGNYQRSFSCFCSAFKCWGKKELENDTLYHFLYVCLYTNSINELPELVLNNGIFYQIIERLSEIHCYKKNALDFYEKSKRKTSQFILIQSLCNRAKLYYDLYDYQKCLTIIDDIKEKISSFIEKNQNKNNSDVNRIKETALFLEAKAYFNLNGYKDCFDGLTNLYLINKKTRFLNKKDELLSDIFNDDDKQKFLYEETFNKALLPLNNYEYEKKDKEGRKNNKYLKNFYDICQGLLSRMDDLSDGFIKNRREFIISKIIEVYNTTRDYDNPFHFLPNGEILKQINMHYLHSNIKDFNTYRNLGTLFKDIKKYHIARFFYKKALENSKNDTQRSICYNNLTKLFIETKEYLKANNNNKELKKYAKGNFIKFYKENKEKIENNTK